MIKILSILIIDITSVIFGIAALILVSRARERLTAGSIRRNIDNFSVCLSFIIILSIWRTFKDVVFLKQGLPMTIEFPEYLFIICTSIAFIIASYRVSVIGHEFGFKKEGEKVTRILDKNNKS